MLHLSEAEKNSENKEIRLISKVSEDSISRLRTAAQIRIDLRDIDECLIRVNNFL